MPRIVPRIPLFRPLTRLGGFAARPLLPLTANFASPFRSPSPLHIPNGTGYQNYSSSTSRRSSSNPPSPSPSDKLPENATLTERLKYTMKKYGWYALGMYIFFSTLDFSLTFAAVNYLGADYATQLMESIKAALPSIFGGHDADPSQPPDTTKPGREGLYAMLVLTYTIHKTLLLPFRVGLTAAFTPRFVNWLGRRGWTGSGGAKRAMTEARQKLRRNSNSSSSSQHSDSQ